MSEAGWGWGETLTFKSVLKHLSCKKSQRCGKFGLCWSLGRVGVFSSLGQETGPASKLQGPGWLSTHPEALEGKESISVPIWGLRPLFAFQGSLLPEETCKIFLWRACCVEATGNKGLLQSPPNQEVGVHLRITVFQATCYFYQMFSKAGLMHSIWEVFLFFETEST
jgi:hypothetical protein